MSEAERTMTRRGRRARPRKKPEPAPAGKLPRSRTACTARLGCSAAHDGAFYADACIVCGEITMQLQPVAAWDAPCCSSHDLHADYRVRVVLRPGFPPEFRAERKIVLAEAKP